MQWGRQTSKGEARRKMDIFHEDGGQQFDSLVGNGYGFVLARGAHQQEGKAWLEACELWRCVVEDGGEEGFKLP